ncbi:MAG: hypothetical protein NBKEAIPA_01007 [Nitrospirae bacterium]|nr:hypothetical protein [Nitrospirota bacterium]MCK6494182.1 hypothetical protein [Nitrospira sp.]MCK6499173.1 hypothetical protein [Nitrospira sp.]MEB2338505.1 hypothetical protein [Nitrospirales bacterium]QOJ33956.1 MAG: hypothetical protein HRU82_02875 [Nitrospira sp.]
MALVQQNLVPGTGDHLITLDTETNLEWLSLDATLNLSYLEVLSGAGGYTTTYGFRYATGAEIALLLQHAGITKYGLTQVVPFPQSNHVAMETFIELMGGVSLYPSVTSGSVLIQTQGMMKFRGAGVPSPTVPMSASQLWLFKNNPNSSYADTNPAGPAGKRAPEIASYLVRNGVQAASSLSRSKTVVKTRTSRRR